MERENLSSSPRTLLSHLCKLRCIPCICRSTKSLLASVNAICWTPCGSRLSWLSTTATSVTWCKCSSATCSTPQSTTPHCSLITFWISARSLPQWVHPLRKSYVNKMKTWHRSCGSVYIIWLYTVSNWHKLQSYGSVCTEIQKYIPDSIHCYALVCAAQTTEQVFIVLTFVFVSTAFPSLPIYWDKHIHKCQEICLVYTLLNWPIFCLTQAPLKQCNQ